MHTPKILQFDRFYPVKPWFWVTYLWHCICESNFDNSLVQSSVLSTPLYMRILQPNILCVLWIHTKTTLHTYRMIISFVCYSTCIHISIHIYRKRPFSKIQAPFRCIFIVCVSPHLILQERQSNKNAPNRNEFRFIFINNWIAFLYSNKPKIINLAQTSESYILLWNNP